jgi:hypothetical protein
MQLKIRMNLQINAQTVAMFTLSCNLVSSENPPSSATIRAAGGDGFLPFSKIRFDVWSEEIVEDNSAYDNANYPTKISSSNK